jgi:hypothetical protein
MKKNMYIVFLTAILGLVAACSKDTSPYAALGADEYPQKFYMEYIPCMQGPDYSLEAFNSKMLPSWQVLLEETNSPLVSAWGLVHEDPKETDTEDGFWQLVWNSKADAASAWETWGGYDKANEWTEENLNILNCNNDSVYSFDAYVRRSIDSFGEFDTTNFSSDYQACNYNEGYGADDLRATVEKFEDYLNSPDANNGPYGYVILAPDPDNYPEDQEQPDFFWGNFNQTAEQRDLGFENFIANAKSVDEEFNKISTCEVPENYVSGEIPLS